MRKRNIRTRVPRAFQVVAATGFIVSCSGFYNILADNTKSLSYESFSYNNIPDTVVNDQQLFQKRLEALSIPAQINYNGEVKKYINLYLGKRRKELKRFIAKKYEYEAVIEDILIKHNVPGHLKSLIVVESEYNANAGSVKGAVGFWQLMPATARAYNLKVNPKVDDRKDPYKSTEAAAAYLNDLHRIHKDWLLVIAAYNCGSKRVHEAVKKSGGNRDFWTIRKYLPKETRDFVPKFIAAAYVMEYYRQHDIKVYHTPAKRADILPGNLSQLYLQPIEL